MSKHVAMKITVGYNFVKEETDHNLVELFFQDWLYSNCSASVDDSKKEFTVSEEEYTWLIIAYPAVTLSKYVDIDFDNYKKEYHDGN